MTRSHTFFTLSLAAVLFGSGAHAQVVAGYTPPPATPEVLAAYGLSAGTVQQLSPELVTPTSMQFIVWIDGEAEILDLTQHDMRSPTYTALATDANGTIVVPSGPTTTYRGTLLGRSGSVVAASYFGGSLRATIWFDRDLPAWGVDPLSQVVPGAPADQHLVYCSADVTTQGTCGVSAGAGWQPIPGVPSGIDVLEEAQAMIVCDAPFSQIYGNNTTTIQNTILGVMNAVDVIYDRDVEVTYDVNIVQMFIGSDPFTTNLACDDFQPNLLDQFTSYALSTHGGVERDINHLFSGRNFTGSTLGCAFDGFTTGTVCTNAAYGVSDMISVQNQTSRAGLVSHEMGHNWHAQHCSGGGGCQIMCDGLGGCTGNITAFDATAISQIVAFKNTINCLDNAGGPPPVLSSVTPNVLEVMSGQTIQLTGTNLTTVTELRFIGFQLDPGEFLIPNDNLITFEAPTPLNFFPNFVWAVGQGGSSNLLPVTFIPATNASIEVPTFHSPATSGDWPIDYAHQPGYLYAIFGSLNNPATVPVLGIDFLVGAFQISAGTLDPVLGFGSLEIDVLPGTLGAQTIYMQLVTIDNGFTTLFDSPVDATFFLN